MREPRQPTATDGYERPQQTWQCGLADDGPACPLGPDGSGHCPAVAACRPVRDGERWQCNRSDLRGGPCGSGPGPDGSCGIVYHCTPLRSLRTRRGRFLVGVLAGAFGAACMALSGAGRNQLIAPGPLSAHHAQLVDRGGAAGQCAHCHAAAELTAGQWWAHSSAEPSTTPTQSTLCLACHERTVDRKFALAAHGVPLEQLHAADDGAVTVAWDRRTRDPREPIACSACHREHQGLDHNLATVANDACQACHQEQYHSLADDHPEFGVWPYERRTRIAFDHASHQAKHFPSERREFACTTCHQPDAAGRRQLTGSYATTCAECHDKTISVSLAEGMPLFALPTIDVEALAAAGLHADGWPEEAAGDFEGAQPTPAVVLLTSDPSVQSAAAFLAPALDLYDVNPDDRMQLKSAADVATAIHKLVDDVAARGQTVIEERVSSLLGRKLQRTELTALSGGLSPDVVSGFRDRWLGASQSEPAASRADGLQMVRAGGWVRDDATLSLRYQPTGHADPWLRAWLDVVAEAASGPHAALFDPLLRSAMKPTAPGQCGSCHGIERDSGGRLSIQWRPFDPLSEPTGFTRFDHRPHVIQPQTGDCQTCHQIRSVASGAATYSGDDPRQFVSGFEPMDKASCAACHTPHAAGDGCTQCHSYHGDGI